MKTRNTHNFGIDQTKLYNQTTRSASTTL